MVGKNLKRIMQEKGYSVTRLAQESGIGKSSISQYLSGKNTPSDERVVIIANVLDCTVEELSTILPDQEVPKYVIPMEEGAFNVPVEVVAKLMHKKNSFVYEGLRQGIFPWGYAVKTSSQWSYYISSKKFTEHTGIPVIV